MVTTVVMSSLCAVFLLSFWFILRPSRDKVDGLRDEVACLEAGKKYAQEQYDKYYGLYGKAQSNRQRTKYFLGLVNWLRTSWKNSPREVWTFMGEDSLHGALDYYEKTRFPHWPVGSGKRTNLHRTVNECDHLEDR